MCVLGGGWSGVLIFKGIFVFVGVLVFAGVFIFESERLSFQRGSSFLLVAFVFCFHLDYPFNHKSDFLARPVKFELSILR